MHVGVLDELKSCCMVFGYCQLDAQRTVVDIVGAEMSDQPVRLSPRCLPGPPHVVPFTSISHGAPRRIVFGPFGNGISVLWNTVRLGLCLNLKK